MIALLGLTVGLHHVDRPLGRLEMQARDRGVAVGIATALPVTIARLADWAKKVEGRGFVLVPITSVAIFRLIEEGRLGLGDRVLGREGILGETYGKIESERLRAITVDHLLTHTAGGWPNDGTDPMFRTPEADLKTLIETTIAFHPPRGDPGTYFAYSNFGYCLLGRVIEVRRSLEP